MFCKYCGRELSEGAEFCGNCGTKTTGALQTKNEFNQSKKEERNELSKALLVTFGSLALLVVCGFFLYHLVIKDLIQIGKKGVEWASEKIEEIQENRQRTTTNSSNNTQQEKTSNSSNTQNVIDVDIDTLLREIGNNAARTQQIYGGKVIRTTGRVKDINEYVFFIVGNDYGVEDLLVNLISYEKSKLVNLQIGQTVTVRGVFKVNINFGTIGSASIE